MRKGERMSLINLRLRERPGQEGKAMESGIAQEMRTKGKDRRKVSINLDKIFLMLSSCQLLSLTVNAQGNAE